LQALVSIWGTGPDNLYLTGFMNEQILHVDYDPVGGGAPVVTPIELTFPATKAHAEPAEFDELGLPRF